MNRTTAFRVVLIKPSKYGNDGFVQRFRRGFIPNSTLLHLRSMTPSALAGRPVDVKMVDEYTATSLTYLRWLQQESCDLLALVGVQSHQMHRALDLCALARSNGVRCCVIGGPHPMTCDTSEVQGRGVSFAVAEAELIWDAILQDASSGELRPVYGSGKPWQEELNSPVISPPSSEDLRHYIIPMVGIYPARGCPFSCNFCSVVKIAGKRVRSQPVTTTLQSLLRVKASGVRLVMFTSDNFNKYPAVRDLLNAMIEERVEIPFFAQCDVQLGRDEELIELLARAGCVQVFVGVESFSRATLKSVRKFQNDPFMYRELVQRCHRYGVSTHFSNILGFPEQGEQEILAHLGELRAIRPFMASFYILTPIPGTDQYDDFRRDGLICESNLDRFDATCLVWRHPKLARKRLEILLARCYRDFYALDDVVEKVLLHRWNAPGFVYGLGLSFPVFARWAALRGRHPMAGGFWQVSRDGDGEYLPIRRSIFNIDQLSLPTSISVTGNSNQALYLANAVT